MTSHPASEAKRSSSKLEYPSLPTVKSQGVTIGEEGKQMQTPFIQRASNGDFTLRHWTFHISRI